MDRKKQRWRKAQLGSEGKQESGKDRKEKGRVRVSSKGDK